MANKFSQPRQKHFNITGMTCAGCMAKVKYLLEQIPGVIDVADIQLESPQVKLALEETVSIANLEAALSSHKYEIKELVSDVETKINDKRDTFSLISYKPLILIVLFIAGVCLLAQYPFNEFDVHKYMRHFMAGFFIVFSFFKLLDIEGFAGSYSMYDLLAEKWKGWAYIYPFIELGLGISYLIDYMPWYTNLTCLLVLAFSSIGVIKSNLDNRKIQCACLGSVFNLPMSFITILENALMMSMAAYVLLLK